MSAQAEAEASPRVSTDTIIDGRPPSPKVEGPSGLEAQQTAARGNDAGNRVASPLAEVLNLPRPEAPPESQHVQWEHIMAQLGMGSEDRRIDWERMRNELGLSEDDEEPASLLKQIGQACLVLATTPFMLLHGVFKMAGAFLKSLGMIFTGLAKLSGKLIFKPGRRRNRRAGMLLRC